MYKSVAQQHLEPGGKWLDIVDGNAAFGGASRYSRVVVYDRLFDQPSAMGPSCSTDP